MRSSMGQIWVPTCSFSWFSRGWIDGWLRLRSLCGCGFNWRTLSNVLAYRWSWCPFGGWIGWGRRWGFGWLRGWIRRVIIWVVFGFFSLGLFYCWNLGLFWCLNTGPFCRFFVFTFIQLRAFSNCNFDKP